MARPSLGDRIAFLIARHHARRVYARFMAATRRATAVQEAVLLRKIRRNADSDFGRDYRFDRIHSAADFVRRVPILSYEDHQPYIERVKRGQLGAMFGPGQRVHMFALSSGTTSEPKYIPVTDAFLDEYRRGWNAFGIKALLDHPQAFLRRIAQVASRMDESRTSAGIPCGAISGLMAATQKRLVRKYYVAPECISRIEDATSKYYTVMRLAVPSDVAFLITASPATQLKLAQTADQYRQELIRDVRDGTLWAELDVPGEVRQALSRRLRPDRAAAARLEALVASRGALLAKDYWALAFIANWTGGTMGLYLHDFPKYFGDVPVRDIGLLASEGRVSIPVEDGTPAGILEVTGSFFEFIPRDRVEEASPRAFRSHELEIGAEYFVLLTTSSGLYRYRLGDLVRVVSWAGEAPIIEFLNKGEHTCSLAGEKLTEHQVIMAMERVARQLCWRGSQFILAPRWAQPPRYVLHVESGSLDGALGERLATELDLQLAAVNLEYSSRRRSERLGPVAVNLLPSGFLDTRDRAEAERRRKGNEQYKHQYLFSRPGQDADFPSGEHVASA